MTSALLGNPVIRLVHGPDPARWDQPGLLDRIGYVEQLGMRRVHFTGGSATVGGIASVTRPDCDRIRFTADRQLRYRLFTPSDADRRDRCAPKPMAGSWMARGEGIAAQPTQ